MPWSLAARAPRVHTATTSSCLTCPLPHHLLPLSPRSLCSSHTRLLTQSHQARFCLRAFAWLCSLPGASFLGSVLPPMTLPSPPLGLCTNVALPQGREACPGPLWKIPASSHSIPFLSPITKGPCKSPFIWFVIRLPYRTVNPTRMGVFVPYSSLCSWHPAAAQETWV